MKPIVTKIAVVAAVVASSVVGVAVANANAAPVLDKAIAIATPHALPNAQMTNMDLVQAGGPGHLTNKAYARSSQGCLHCNALAMSVQVDLVSNSPSQPNETDVATVVDNGNQDQTSAVAAMFVVNAPGIVSLSGRGRSQLGAIGRRLAVLTLVGSTTAAVQSHVNALLTQIVQTLETYVTVTLPPVSGPNQGGPPEVAPATSQTAAVPAGEVPVTSNIQFAS